MKNILPRRFAKYLRRKLGGIEAAPRKIAMGYAVGFFLGALPIMTFRVALALGLAIVFKWNKTATLLGVFLINPLTLFPFYIPAFTIGQLILGSDIPITPGEWDAQALLQAFWDDGHFFLVLITGSIALALPISVFLYWSAYKVVSYLQSNHFSPKPDNHEIPDHWRQRLYRDPPGTPTGSSRERSTCIHPSGNGRFPDTTSQYPDFRGRRPPA
jgi:uncharacterized protein (DUF2062 family)